MLGSFIAAAPTASAADKQQMMGPSCVDVVLNPPDVVFDPGCAGLQTTMAAGHGGSMLGLSVEASGIGAELAWAIPANWTDEDLDNGELDEIRILRGSTPVTMETLAIAPEDARSFQDDTAVLDGALWYQLVAVGEDGSTLETSDRVLMSPA